MTRHEFIDAVVIARCGNPNYTGHVTAVFDFAEKLADERAKRYPFDDEVESHDPYAVDCSYLVNWDEAPEWAMYHAVDESGCGYWHKEIPFVFYSVWRQDRCMRKSKNYPNNPNWRESLRERP
jgi:hypothetical protein